MMEIGSSSSSICHQQEGRIVELGLTSVRIYKTSNEKEKKSIPKVFGFRTIHRKEEPIIDPSIQDEGELPPYVIVVHGPPEVGKSLLITCLVNYYNSNGGSGDEVIVLANHRRIQFVECPNNVNGMIDAAKYADAVIFLIDGRYGFEMETFEFLNILQVHGIVKVMGVLTYLDCVENDEILKETKQSLMDDFHSEIDEAASIFCLPFLENIYSAEEICKLASFLSDTHFHHLSWRATQPYLLIKDFEDVTPQERVQKNWRCNRDIVLKGYLRGCNNIKEGTKVHIAGVGDFPLFQVESLVDPFPSLGKEGFKIGSPRTGTYLRLEVRGVPSEMVESRCRPILVGGIGIEEEKAGYMQATLMRHSWQSKLLNTRDPIIVSIGWRRYQTQPIYAMDYCRGRLQMLSCTPKDKQYIAMFWGPLAPPSTGVVVVKRMADHEAPFRILATGIVHDNNQAKKVFERRSPVGTSWKIFNETAQTKNGLRRKIKKAADKRLVDLLKTKNSKPRDGIAKCKFKRTIDKAGLTSSCVWIPVKVPRVFHPLLAALKPRDRIWKYFGPADNGESESGCDSESELESDDDIPRDKEAPKQTKEEIKVILDRLQKENDAAMGGENYCEGWRETLELQRAVIFVKGETSTGTRRFNVKDLWT